MAVSSTNVFREAIRQRGFTQASLAAELGCSRSHLTKVVAGADGIGGLRARLLALGFTEAELVVPSPGVQLAERRALAEREANHVALADLTLGDLVAASRRAQGLPDRVEDPHVLDAVARVIATALLRTEAPSGKGRR